MATGSPPGLPAYHHGNLRTALIQAALARLESGESEELSLRELARATGVTVSAAYRHFADKAAVLAAVATEGFKQLAAIQRQTAAANAGLDDVVLSMGRAYIGFAVAHPELFRLMFSSMHRSGAGEIGEASAAAFQPLLENIAQCIGAPPAQEGALAAAVHAWATVHGLSHLLLDRQLERFTEEPERLVAAALSAMSGETRQMGTPVGIEPAPRTQKDRKPARKSSARRPR